MEILAYLSGPARVRTRGSASTPTASQNFAGTGPKKTYLDTQELAKSTILGKLRKTRGNGH